MLSIKRARRLIEEAPDSEEAKTLASLVLALEGGTPFYLEKLYELKLETFDLATAVLAEWRLARYDKPKAKLLDIAVQLHELDDPAAAP